MLCLFQLELGVFFYCGKVFMMMCSVTEGGFCPRHLSYWTVSPTHCVAERLNSPRNTTEGKSALSVAIGPVTVWPTTCSTLTYTLLWYILLYAANRSEQMNVDRWSPALIGLIRYDIKRYATVCSWIRLSGYPLISWFLVLPPSIEQLRATSYTCTQL